MSQPIPDRLIRSLARSPLPDPYRASRHVNGNLTPNLRETLLLVCQGYTNREIAEARHYSEEATKDHVKRLLGMFGARNRTHLAAMAVLAMARGDVEVG